MPDTPARRSARPPGGPSSPPPRSGGPAGVPAQQAGTRRVPPVTLAAVAAGGVIGALARHGLATAFPHPPGGFPWVTFATNVIGCALIGVLMVLLTEAGRGHPLARPFLGPGVLGGFTTFSAYVADIGGLAAGGAPQVALVYLSATVTAAVTATHLAAQATRALAGLRRTGPSGEAG
ncbi:fluoride efflux transporter FluC [Planobispora siamensis]|uniref:Fluoride-specific ion channel FluC n=1 Tax=Planobispora siamensis TaxID=936338 RepID=A0A8J3SSH8_9ACTN|nr:CrcB family protein [Planobispora siamensis]GIH97900.1 putative fluoride ion transporter CrcB 1 [Planobispora siamensis]